MDSRRTTNSKTRGDHLHESHLQHPSALLRLVSPIRQFQTICPNKTPVAPARGVDAAWEGGDAVSTVLPSADLDSGRRWLGILPANHHWTLVLVAFYSIASCLLFVWCRQTPRMPLLISLLLSTVNPDSARRGQKRPPTIASFGDERRG
jgi:hypothetical protein